jgi:DDE domain
MDETYIKVKGQWYYLYRAVDRTGQTIDILLTEQRDQQAAKRFFPRRFVAMAPPRRSPSMGVRPMRPPSGGKTRNTARRSSSVRSNISIIGRNRIIDWRNAA